MLPCIRLSLIIPCAPQDEPQLQELLSSIDRQCFQKEELEVLIMREGNSEEAKAYGIQRSQGAILGLLCADNQLLGNTFLSEMCAAAENPGVIGAYPRHYAWMSQDPPLNRYFALLGANDPLCWWLGKADRSMHGGRPARRVDRVTFGRVLPSVGDNGFFVKAAAIKPFVTDPARHFCIDVCEDMRRAGLATYTITPNVIWHKTGSSFWTWLKKRWRYTNELYWRDYAKRRWKMVDTPRDWWLCLWFAIASGLLLPQVFVVLRGYRRVKDPAWLWHVPICLCCTLLYTCAMMRHCWLVWLSRLWTVLTNSRFASRA